MILDFHAHTFPEKIARKALGTLAKSGEVKYYLNGTTEDLQRSMAEAGVDYSVLLPVATRAGQTDTINRTALEINEHTEDTGILSFGGIHPDNDNYRDIIRMLAAHHVKGIKLHPVFQNTYMDDIRYMRIVECACEYGMIIMIHAGYDNSFPGIDFVLPRHITPLLDRIRPDKMILAHMGGWGCWDEVEEQIVGRDVYLDTSFTITPFRQTDGSQSGIEPLDSGQFLRIIRKHGVSKILFGSDSPWAAQDEAIQTLRDSGLSKEECDRILGENGGRLLGMAQ